MKSLTPFLIIIVCIVAYFLYIGPQLDEIVTLRTKLANYQKTLDDSKNLKANLDKMLVAYNSVPEEDRVKLDKMIPSKFNDVNFVSDMNNIASKNSITINNIKILDNQSEQEGVVVSQENSTPYQTAKATFTMSGSYEQFVKTLRDIESSVRLVDVKSVSIKEPQQKTKGSQYEYLIEVNTYYLR